jgi:predicted nucleotidyltransferase
MLFDQLMEAELPTDLLQIVQGLVDVKRQTPELGNGTRIPELDAYIQEQLEELQCIAEQEENRKNDWEKLDEFFRMAVNKGNKVVVLGGEKYPAQYSQRFKH